MPQLREWELLEGRGDVEVSRGLLIEVRSWENDKEDIEIIDLNRDDDVARLIHLHFDEMDDLMIELNGIQDYTKGLEYAIDRMQCKHAQAEQENIRFWMKTVRMAIGLLFFLMFFFMVDYPNILHTIHQELGS